MIPFKEALRTKDFVFTVELPLHPDSTRQSILAAAAPLAERVDGFLLTDNQYGQPHLSPTIAAQMLNDKGLAPILQLSCRNRNRIALMGELLAARAAGIDGLMLVRGGVLPEGYSPRPRAVMDIDTRELVAMAERMNEQRAPDQPEFLLGTSATVHAPGPGAEPKDLIAKADAGARILITQVCLDADVVRRYLDFLIGYKLLRRLSVIVSVAVVTSPEAARWLAANRRGTVIPETVLRAIGAEGGNKQAAIERTGRLVAELMDVPGLSGVNFASLEDPSLVARVLDAAGVVA